MALANKIETGNIIDFENWPVLEKEPGSRWQGIYVNDYNEYPAILIEGSWEDCRTELIVKLNQYWIECFKQYPNYINDINLTRRERDLNKLKSAVPEQELFFKGNRGIFRISKIEL